MEREELIDKFIRGTLTQDEKTQFDELHESDLSFKEEVAILTDLAVISGVEDREQLRQHINDFESKITSKETKVIPLFLNKKWLIAASIVLIAVIGGITLLNPPAIDTTALYAANFEPYKNVVTPIIRGETDENEEVTAFTLYEAKEYTKAADQFGHLFTTTKKPYLLLYQANALLAVDQSKEAITILEQHIELNDQLVERSRWYLALAYLKENRKEEATFILNEIVRRGAFKQSDAKKLLEKLN